MLGILRLHCQGDPYIEVKNKSKAKIEVDSKEMDQTDVGEICIDPLPLVLYTDDEENFYILSHKEKLLFL